MRNPDLPERYAESGFSEKILSYAKTTRGDEPVCPLNRNYCTG
jgi:hypothetical protein